MEDILLIHRKSNANSTMSPIVGNCVWATCLRQVAFFDEASFELTCAQEDQILRGAEALKFLLEVLAGLRSPVLGETEVLGQFRQFIESRRLVGDPLFSEQRKWLQFLLGEVKKLRYEFINGLGSNSYGGIVRQQSRAFGSVAIFGSGHLAKEILPWLMQKSELRLICRNPQQVVLADSKYAKVKIGTYENFQNTSEVVVIAAPLEDAQILQLLDLPAFAGSVKKIFDLRGENNQLKLLLSKSAVEILSLGDMFAELAGSRKENESKVALVKKVIKQRVDQFMERSELRPMGWDDICA